MIMSQEINAKTCSTKSQKHNMHTVQEIEASVAKLSPSDLINFRNWFDKFDQKAWDDQFEKDVKTGKLDSLADQAIADLKAGKCKKI